MVLNTGRNADSRPTKKYTYNSEGKNSKHMLKIKEEKEEGEEKTRKFSIKNKELGSTSINIDNNLITIGEKTLKLRNENNLNHLKKILFII